MVDSPALPSGGITILMPTKFTLTCDLLQDYHGQVRKPAGSDRKLCFSRMTLVRPPAYACPASWPDPSSPATTTIASYFTGRCSIAALGSLRLRRAEALPLQSPIARVMRVPLIYLPE